MRWIIAALFVIVAILQVPLWLGEGSYREVRLLRAGVDEIEAEVRGLEERNHALEAEVQDLKQGLDAIEERARSELGLVRADETFIQILRPEHSTNSAARR